MSPGPFPVVSLTRWGLSKHHRSWHHSPAQPGLFGRGWDISSSRSPSFQLFGRRTDLQNNSPVPKCTWWNTGTFQSRDFCGREESSTEKKKHQAKSTNLLFLEERARNSTYPSFTSQRRTALLDVTPPLFTFEAYRGKEMLEETINQLKQLLKHYQHCSSPGPQWFFYFLQQQQKQSMCDSEIKQLQKLEWEIETLQDL